MTDGGDFRENLESTGIHSVSENIFRQETIARLRFNGERKFEDDSDMFYLKSEVFSPSIWVPTPAESCISLNVCASNRNLLNLTSIGTSSQKYIRDLSRAWDNEPTNHLDEMHSVVSMFEIVADMAIQSFTSEIMVLELNLCHEASYLAAGGSFAYKLEHVIVLQDFSNSTELQKTREGFLMYQYGYQ